MTERPPNILELQFKPESPEPHRFDLDRDVTPEQWQTINKYLEEDATLKHWFRFADLAVLKTLHTGTPPQLSTKEWGEIAAARRGALDLDSIATVSILEALRTGTPPMLSGTDKREITRLSEKYVAEGNWYSLAPLASLEALDSGIPPHLSPEQREEITNERERAAAYSLARLATLEALGSSSKITLKPGGGITLEYDTAEHTDDTPPPIPEPRNF